MSFSLSVCLSLALSLCLGFIMFNSAVSLASIVSFSHCRFANLGINGLIAKTPTRGENVLNCDFSSAVWLLVSNIVRGGRNDLVKTMARVKWPPWVRL